MGQQRNDGGMEDFERDHLEREEQRRREERWAGAGPRATKVYRPRKDIFNDFNDEEFQQKFRREEK